jgi:hypothetical protein
MQERSAPLLTGTFFKTHFLNSKHNRFQCGFGLENVGHQTILNISQLFYSKLLVYVGLCWFMLVYDRANQQIS